MIGWCMLFVVMVSLGLIVIVGLFIVLLKGDVGKMFNLCVELVVLICLVVLGVFVIMVFGVGVMFMLYMYVVLIFV